jgi:glycosyltransferase involved in cell wall biosynthesis
VSVPTISAVVLTGNVERHLAACLRGLAWADEVMVLDGGSRDRTVAIAEAAGARVERRPFDDFAHQRQAALDRARGEWVLFVDDDERVSAGLAAEVRAAAASGRAHGYWVPRRNYIWGRWIRGGGWFPDAQLRLLRRDKARYDLGGLVHEVAIVDGRLGTLDCAIVHYNYETVGQFLRKQRRYAGLDARMQVARGERGRVRRLLSMPARELWRRYVRLDGRRDGLHGAALAALTALAAADTQRQVLLGGRTGADGQGVAEVP